MTIIDWIDVSEEMPVKSAEGDYGDFWESEDVFFTDGKKIRVGYYQHWNEDYACCWKSGEYEIENVVKWAYLPDEFRAKKGK